MHRWSSRAPLFEAMLAYSQHTMGRFHVPGHKARAAAFGPGASFYENVLALDVTELPGLDDLHHPEEAIEEAQHMAAVCFGAEETWFLVNGSTVGNQAMIAAVCQPGDLLLVQRDVHKSVIHGLMLAGAQAVFIYPRTDTQSGLRIGVSAEDVQEALRRYPAAKGLIVTNPTYYGIGTDLKPLAKLLHDQDKLLLVDEAHGAHYGWHPRLPQSAMACGADAAVQSTHKMLTALTMSSMLHVQGPRINRTALRRILGMLQSSSPSYLLMASLDLGRQYLQEQGTQALDEGLAMLDSWNVRLAARPRWGSARPSNAEYRMDPFKSVLYDTEGVLDGYRLKAELERYGCYPEMADADRVVLAFSLASTLEDSERLIEALDRIEEQHPIPISTRRIESSRVANECAAAAGMPMKLWVSEPVPFGIGSIHDDDKSTIAIPLDECEGYTAAEMIVPYPPGIPVLYPGERITADTVADLRRLATAGAKFQGHNVTERGTVPVRLPHLENRD
ncbi:aminotransferase class I/II-fold pyridoxal phosphate-dependent enzyme [Paenibacillus filicis]|uniref:Aminotransferase class I/II-fold pyridoxal phosphate-dependent enzyme n=1 Tax=Paenibacillus filicis TaxID=669464 RepID=A0ABU9DVY9_9BACL